MNAAHFGIFGFSVRPPWKTKNVLTGDREAYFLEHVKFRGHAVFAMPLVPCNLHSESNDAVLISRLRPL